MECLGSNHTYLKFLQSKSICKTKFKYVTTSFSHSSRLLSISPHLALIILQERTGRKVQKLRYTSEDLEF